VNPDVIIRSASAADQPALGALGALLVRVHHDFDERRFIPPTPQTETGYGSFLESQVSKKNVVMLVAEQNGEAIGYVYAGIEGYDYMSLRGPGGVIYDIIVDPAHRHAGIGAMLLKGAIDEMASRGANQIVLSTAVQNEPAQRLFARAGFRRTMIEMTRDAG
jgi:ribosomal protein S18 acetylase RimI-like enzyme